MGIKFRRAVYQVKDKSGRLKAKSLSIPTEAVTGEEHTGALDYLVLSDPQGQIPESILYQWLEEIIEPLRLKWLEEKRKEVE